jgi:DnaK suppressor protein
VTQPDTPNDYRQRLLGQRAKLLAQISAQRAGVRNRAEVAEEHFAHPEDSPAQVSSERDLEFALNERETAELCEIAAALERLDLGTYGQCTDCGSPIPTLRLQALPEASRCITCQERSEQLPPSVRA